jgi:hypothetical protein
MDSGKDYILKDRTQEISDDEDCTFRYHITIVFAHYLMKRLTKRLGIVV